MNTHSFYHFWESIYSIYAKKTIYINQIFRIIMYDVCSLDNLTSHTIAFLDKKGK